MQVDPTFHDDASNMEQLVPFEECIELHSTAEAVVKAPGYLMLTHNGRTFKLVGTIFCISENLDNLCRPLKVVSLSLSSILSLLKSL